MVERIREAGYNIEWEHVKAYAGGGTGVYKQHSMHDLIDRFTDAIYSPLYKTLFACGRDGKELGIAYLPLTIMNHDTTIGLREAAALPNAAPSPPPDITALPEPDAAVLPEPDNPTVRMCGTLR